MSRRRQLPQRAASWALAVFGLVVSPCAAQTSQSLWSTQPIQADLPAGSTLDEVVHRDRGESSAGIGGRKQADAHTLLRRVSFALTGLPPRRAQILAFVDNPSDAAYAKLVAELLASPEYGERWGRHWLDVVRFGESSGGGRSLMFPDAWRFRDYVIESFQADRPFDEFLTEQIAGDLMPAPSEAIRRRRLVATGFLELGPTNYELQDKELLRMDVIDEQIDTVGRAFMGLTLGCARCHDHKFDPVPTRDYYALAGIFGSTKTLVPGNVSGPVKRELIGAEARQWHADNNRIQAIRAILARSGARRSLNLRKVDFAGQVLDDADAKVVGRWAKSKSVQGYVGRGYIHDGGRGGAQSVRFACKVKKAGDYEVRLAYTPHPNRASNTLVVVRHAGGASRLRVNQQAKPESVEMFHSLGVFRFEPSRAASVTVSNKGADGCVVADAVQIVSVDIVAEAGVATTRAEAAARDMGDPALAKRVWLRRELLKCKKNHAAHAPRAMAAREAKQPRDGHIHNRGLVRSKGPVVPRGYLSSWGGEKPAIPATASGRLQLAQWLTSATHPLTARVYVNRVWHHLFGRGIVRTVDNFGQSGARPDDLALLDWLARRFVDSGWSTKKLIRDIVLSRTFRQPAVAPDKLGADTRGLGLVQRQRLDAESIRDAVLTVSGQLDRTRGGSTIHKISTYDYGYEFRSSRRSVYVPRFRSEQLEIFEVFDAPDPSLVSGARNVSVVPTQALFLMNNPWLIEQADHAAGRLLEALPAADAAARVHRAFLWALGRPPTVAEKAFALRFVQRGRDEDPAKPWAGLFRTLFACLDFRYVD